MQIQESARPKICVVSTTPLTIHFFLKPHLRALSEFSDVFLALNPGNDPYTPDLQLPVRVVPISIKRDIAFFADIRALKQLYILFRREKPDLVWAVTPKGGLLGMLAAWIAGVKCRVFIFQGEVWASKVGPMRWILKLADKMCAYCATKLLAVSFTERLLLEQEKIVPAGSVQVLGKGSISGVDLERYKPDIETRRAIRGEYKIPSDAVVALFAGRLTKDKGIYELAEAFHRLSAVRDNIWLFIVGPDEQELSADIRDTLGNASAKCVFVGFSSHPEKFMAAADFICLPSYREGFGMVLIEAAAVGIPAIGSKIPGISDAILEGKTGLLVEPKNVNALQSALLQLIDDSDLRQQLGLAARQNVLNNFESAEVVSRYVDLFRSLLYPA
jgi:glycosyltransferase involved in cell wall biosynthesis